MKLVIEAAVSSNLHCSNSESNQEKVKNGQE